MSAYLAQIYQSSILIVLGYSETIVLQMGMSKSLKNLLLFKGL
jgi:hypothetical protein